MKKQILGPTLSSALGCLLSLFLLQLCEGSSPTFLPTSVRSASNNINAFAGTGTASSSGTGGPAASATMNIPRSVFQDTVGATYFTEQYGNCARKIDSSGIVYAFAGVCGASGSFSGDGGQATLAGMNFAIGLFISTVGTAYISDFNNNRVRKVSTAGIITTYAGSGSTTNSGNGGAATAGGIYQCAGLWLNSMGVLYVASLNGHQIRSIGVDGILSLFAGTGTSGYSGDGGQATAATINGVEELTGSTTGLVYFSDSSNNYIRSVSTTGIINLVMGSGSTSWGNENVAATSANINYPCGMWKDSANGDLFVSARNMNREVVLTASTGLVSTFAGNGSPSSSGDGGAATSASVYYPDGLYVNSAGVMYLVEVYGHKIRQIYSVAPTAAPSRVPSAAPSMLPSLAPSSAPTVIPTVIPTVLPSNSPTVDPTIAPTLAPSVTPTVSPTPLPSVVPTVCPSVHPSVIPTVNPSLSPTVKPTLVDLPIRDSPSFKVSNALAFAGITSGGGVMSWGAACCGGDSSSVSGLVDSGVVEVVHSKNAFAALMSDGSVVAWGRAAEITGSEQFRSYTSIVSLVGSDQAFAGVTTSGGVVAFGADCCGGNVDQYGWAQYLSSDVSSVSASAGAVCALKSDGTVYCWGSKFAGGGVSSLTRSDLSGIVMVSSTRSAFAGMTSDGSVVVWGSTAFGGSMSTTIKSKLDLNTQFIVSGMMAFAAYTSTGGVVSWGYTEGVREAEGSGVGFTLVAHTSYAFAAIRSNGTAVSWGSGNLGGDSSSVSASLQNVSYVVGNRRSFAAITVAGDVVAWGDIESGGRLMANVSSAIGSGVTEIYHTSRAFAVVNGSGGVTAWGNEDRGGSIGTVILNSNVKLLCANDNAFTAIKNDGSAYCWGDATSVIAGPISGNYSQIVSC